MRHQAAYSLLYLSGKTPTKKDVEEFMKKCGVSVDKESLDAFFKKIEGQDVVASVAEGSKKHISMPSGGGGARPAAAAAGGAAPAKEEEKPKEDEPEDVDMGGLFGDDDDDY
jgi:large subunit ribosomal protein LP2